MTPDTYKPVTLNHQAALTDAMQRPGFKQAWDALGEEYSALTALLDTRKVAGLTQDELAQRMGTTKSAVSPVGKPRCETNGIHLRLPPSKNTPTPVVSGWSCNWFESVN